MASGLKPTGISLGSTNPLGVPAGAAGQGHTASNYECTLHGLVAPQYLSSLLTRLRHVSGEENSSTLAEHDLAYFPISSGQRRPEDVQIRLARTLPMDQGIITDTLGVQDTVQWELRIFGHPDPHEEEDFSIPEKDRPIQPPAAQRQVLRVPIQGDPVTFMPSLGYAFAFETIKKGYLFLYQDTIRVSIVHVLTPTHTHVVSSASEPSEKEPWLIEATSLPSSMADTPMAVAKLLQLKEALQGVTDLRVIGHTHMQLVVSDDLRR